LFLSGELKALRKKCLYVEFYKEKIVFDRFGKIYKGEETDFSGKEEVCNSVEVLRPKFC
jgi:hypothetical protein